MTDDLVRLFVDIRDKKMMEDFVCFAFVTLMSFWYR